MRVLTMFFFNKIHDCVGKASSTATNQDRVTDKPHQPSSSFDLALILVVSHLCDLECVVL